MSGEKPSIGSLWQEKNTHNVHRVIRIFVDYSHSSHGTELIEYQNVKHGNGFRFWYFASHWHNDFTLIRENPSIFSYWRHVDTGVMCRVIRVLKGAESLHAVDLIEYQDVESAEYYVRFVSEWHEYFTLVVFGKE